MPKSEGSVVNSMLATSQQHQKAMYNYHTHTILIHTLGFFHYLVDEIILHVTLLHLQLPRIDSNIQKLVIQIKLMIIIVAHFARTK